MLMFTMACAVVLAGCVHSVMVLEFRDVQNFQVVEQQSGEMRWLKVSGLAFHSALAVEGMKQVREGESVKVRVFLVPARADLSGSFEFRVEVPKGVREVVFGDERHPVWRESDASTR